MATAKPSRRTRASESPERAELRRRRLLAVSRVLRTTRTSRHLVQEQVAERAGISKGHVGRMESPRGITSQGDLTLIRLWSVLDALHMTWAEWESAVKREMELEVGGVESTAAAPGVRDELVAIVANTARSLPLTHLELLADFARTLDRHPKLSAVPADWQADADAAARRAGLEGVAGELGDASERAKRNIG